MGGWSEKDINIKTWDIMEEIKAKSYKKEGNFELSFPQPNYVDGLFLEAISKLEQFGVVETTGHLKEGVIEFIYDSYNVKLINQKKFDMLYSELKWDLFPKTQNAEKGIVKDVIKQDEPKIFRIQTGDKDIMINDYIIAKPYQTHPNRELFDYVRSKPKNKLIKKSEMPDWLKADIGNKRLLNMLAGAGFTGQIREAFFPVISKAAIKYRGNEVTRKDLEKAGVKIKQLIKQLELADIKNRK